MGTNCKSIYVNGSKPKAGPKGTFSSDLPQPILLYAGDFPYTSAGNIHFVGSSISSSNAEEIRAGIKIVADTFAAYLGIPYKEEPVYVVRFGQSLS